MPWRRLRASLLIREQVFAGRGAAVLAVAVGQAVAGLGDVADGVRHHPPRAQRIVDVEVEDALHVLRWVGVGAVSGE